MIVTVRENDLYRVSMLFCLFIISIYLSIYTSDASLPPGTPPKEVATVEGPPFLLVPVLSPRLSRLLRSLSHVLSTLFSHLTNGLLLTPVPWTSLVYTLFVNSPSPILSTCANHLYVLPFTLSITPRSIPIALSLIHTAHTHSRCALHSILSDYKLLSGNTFPLHLF